MFPHGTKQPIRKILMNNGWHKLVAQILREERDDIFIFKVNMLRRLPKPVELSHKWVLKKCQYQEPIFYATLFDYP